MVFKWALVMFAIATVAIAVLSKVVAFFNPPRPGRPRSPWLGTVERALRWSVLVPAALALVLLAIAALRG